MESAPKKVLMGELFTDAERLKARELWKVKKNAKQFHEDAVSQIVKPALERINKTTGQENDENYLGYILEFDIICS